MFKSSVLAAPRPLLITILIPSPLLAVIDGEPAELASLDKSSGRVGVTVGGVGVVLVGVGMVSLGVGMVSLGAGVTSLGSSSSFSIAKQNKNKVFH